MSTSASLFESFLGGLEASLSVLLTLGYGVAAARFGLIGHAAIKDASRLCNKLFLPALLIVNVGSQLNAGNLDKYWPVLVWALFYILTSVLIGFVMVKVFKLPAWVTIAASFNNTTSLPLLLAQALASTNILQGLLTADETMTTAIARAKSYFLICSVIKNVLVIGLGSKLLNAGKPPGEQKDQQDEDDQQQDGHPQQSEDEARQATENSSLLPVAASGRMYTWNHEVHNVIDREYSKLPPAAQSTVSVLAALVNPASIGAVIAMIIGLTPFLHKLFFNNFEDGGYLKPWLTVSIQNIGNLFTALQMFVVGGLLNVSLEKKGGNDKLSKSAMAVTFFIRFILWGAVGIPLIYYLASRTTLLSDDPILWFAMMIMPIGPPAMILSTTLEVSGAPEKDQISVAKVLTFFYSVTPIICIAVVAALKAAEAAKSIRGL